MIHPNMGTMLCFLTTDCAITPDVLQGALYDVAKITFNRVSVDGDTSTNDSCVILASAQAGNPVIDSLAISKAILPEASSHKLGILANMFKRRDEIAMKIEADKMHRAVYDCLMLMEVFVALLRRRFKEKDWEMVSIMKNMEKYKGIPQFINK